MIISVYISIGNFISKYEELHSLWLYSLFTSPRVPHPLSSPSLPLIAGYAHTGLCIVPRVNFLSLSGSHLTSTPVTDHAPLSHHSFVIDHVVAKQPLLMRGEAATWPATIKWTEDYLKQNYGQLQFRCVALNNRTVKCKYFEGRVTKSFHGIRVSISQYFQMIHSRNMSLTLTSSLTTINVIMSIYESLNLERIFANEKKANSSFRECH